MKKILIKALKSAGEILTDNFGKISQISVKQNQSNIVTKADLDSEKKVVSIIQSKFKNHTIISEETGFRDKGSEYLWVVDPLDGTSNFASRIPWYGVLISVLKDCKPVMAGIYLPFYDLLYFAEKGKGAFVNNERISITYESDLKNVLLTYSLDFSGDESKTELEVRIIKELVKNIRNFRATNSAVDFCYTAEGKFGGSINQTTKIWDIAAPSLLIQEAGGIVTDIHGDPLNFKVDKSTYLRNFTIIGSNKFLHAKILKLIEKIMP